ncbi:MAG: hypothetical protein CGU28_15500 [Candidatus Dactylopiibacterium carminicum]|uniref:Uncharacterized protein n=1 Tax=Candidatus Dactylopiibacterium carminicum TaxID=857335 RepID=A0A272EN76_9RHOO|nr:hypothetical protein [Candidatus Dactylopiibacterium carminicum]KAF7597970.1 hypothetical protein BGI27_15840 [Candidatus Dactylopiibacterium carminicum]PAS91551.1 MAG: hypothetical protein CGU29_15790 [Candidatus Dactylopiibacterium carminicum]PAS93216.1 MAG: hypothetical protein CGU28_15500 [Candidatus Dactylopiibacterium carminicum]PAS96155.1 MAG: hypothetical protein BSR46_15870 [Candidatus Dactylopiibacterium carminicum]
MRIIYKFRHRDPVSQRIVTSRHRLSREDIELHYPGAVVLEETALMIDANNPAEQWGALCQGLQSGSDQKSS